MSSKAKKDLRLVNDFAFALAEVISVTKDTSKILEFQHCSLNSIAWQSMTLCHPNGMLWSNEYLELAQSA